MMFMPVSLAAISLALALALAISSSKRMPDGKEWTTENLNADTPGSSCYAESEQNCRRYGRLYTWEAAQRACPSLGAGWRLPTNDEWRELASHYGGLMEDANGGKGTFAALMIGGSSGFNAVLGGNRNANDGQYARLDAHGLYWTASETAPSTAWMYNFGRGGQALNRHSGANKQMAASVRCVKE
jgi:uncharacterized protein (TIGR02145 family)